VSWATIRASGGWEQYQYSQYAANYTNEFQGTVFGTFKHTDYLTIRVNDVFGGAATRITTGRSSSTT
jgi:hypothetical protein